MMYHLIYNDSVKIGDLTYAKLASYTFTSFFLEKVFLITGYLLIHGLWEGLTSRGLCNALDIDFQMSDHPLTDTLNNNLPFRYLSSNIFTHNL